MSNCKKCKAEINWVQTSKGKWLPLNPGLLSITDEDTTGEEMVTDLEGKTGSLTLLKEGYVSHFATCPYASDFRKQPDKIEIKELTAIGQDHQVAYMGRKAKEFHSIRYIYKLPCCNYTTGLSVDVDIEKKVKKLDHYQCHRCKREYNLVYYGE